MPPVILLHQSLARSSFADCFKEWRVPFEVKADIPADFVVTGTLDVTARTASGVMVVMDRDRPGTAPMTPSAATAAPSPNATKPWRERLDALLAYRAFASRVVLVQSRSDGRRDAVTEVSLMAACRFVSVVPYVRDADAARFVRTLLSLSASAAANTSPASVAANNTGTETKTGMGAGPGDGPDGARDRPLQEQLRRRDAVVRAAVRKLPRIGGTRVEKVLRHFGSLKGLASVSRRELEDTLGCKDAAAVYDFLHGKRTPQT